MLHDWFRFIIGGPILGAINFILIAICVPNFTGGSSSEISTSWMIIEHLVPAWAVTAASPVHVFEPNQGHLLLMPVSLTRGHRSLCFWVLIGSPTLYFDAVGPAVVASNVLQGPYAQFMIHAQLRIITRFHICYMTPSVCVSSSHCFFLGAVTAKSCRR